MATYLSPDDLAYAVERLDTPDTPNRGHLARVVRNLAEWANDNSDGWAHWPKPSRAAANAITEIHAYTSVEQTAQEMHDVSNHTVRTVLAPVKAFCTRQIAAGRMDAHDRDEILAG